MKKLVNWYKQKMFPRELIVSITNNAVETMLTRRLSFQTPSLSKGRSSFLEYFAQDEAPMEISVLVKIAPVIYRSILKILQDTCLYFAYIWSSNQNNILITAISLEKESAAQIRGAATIEF
jgi:hypothetical protein